MKAILDASPIIAFFDEIDAAPTLLLFHTLGYELAVPDAVCVDDILREPSVNLLDRCLADGSIIRLTPVDPPRVERLQASHLGLGRGESEVILNGVDIKDEEGSVLCVIDDGPARAIAKRMGLPMVGTIGVLNRLAEAGAIPQSERTLLLKRLRDSNFRADPSLFS